MIRASVKRGITGGVDEYKLNVMQVKAIRFEATTPDLPVKHREFLLHASMPDPRKNESNERKRISKMWIGMSKADAEKLAIEILRECFKEQHPAMQRILDLIAPDNP